jgi:GH15 family glucan-1,4-alpha-glucosidase
MWCIEKIICIFINILQKISSQKSFLYENENDHKKDYSPWILCHRWLIWLWLHLCKQDKVNNLITLLKLEQID